MRQLNKEKTPIVFRVGVVLLCAMLITTSMMGGLYARYTTTVTGSATARVAKIDVAVTYDGLPGYTLKDVSFDTDVFAVVETFTVENNGEVSYTYDIQLRLSKDTNVSSFDKPAYQTQFKLSKPEKSITKVLGDTGLSVAIAKGFQTGKAYYAFSTDGTSYGDWIATDVNANTITIVNSPALAIGGKHYYKTIYFVVMDEGLMGSDNSLNCPTMTLFYKITCEQVE